MSPEIALNFVFPAAVFVLGTFIGAFLNKVIHRAKPGFGLGKMGRPVCESCKTPTSSIPVLGWLLRLGKCKTCKTRVPARYVLIELLTGFLFFVSWLFFSSSLSLWGVGALWLLAMLLITAAFIDYDHLVIPNSITRGGLVLGLGFSALAPGLHKETAWFNGLFSGMVGVLCGYALLWMIMKIGKMRFGRITHEHDEPVEFTVSQPGGEDSPIMIGLGEAKYFWHEVFFRRRDRMPMEVTDVQFNGVPQPVGADFSIVSDGFMIDGEKTDLQSIGDVSGKFTRAEVPREIIGYGNVRFVAMIGAFVGWQAVLVATIGAFGIVAVLRRFLRGSKIPFSPFLALGAMLFVLFKFI